MPNVTIGDNVVINKSIIVSGATINSNCEVGGGNKITVIGEKKIISAESSL